jgi:hypothetical protein
MFSTPMPLMKSRTCGVTHDKKGVTRQCQTGVPHRHIRQTCTGVAEHASRLTTHTRAAHGRVCTPDTRTHARTHARTAHLVVVHARAQGAEEVDGLAREGVHQHLHVAARHLRARAHEHNNSVSCVRARVCTRPVL